MSPTEIFFLALLIFAAALLYSSVGHGGASGYLGAMALFSLAPTVMKPTALVLNILVAGIAMVKFARAGCFEWHLFWPFAAASVPGAFLGGWLVLPPVYYRPLVGGVLLYAAARLCWRAAAPASAITPLRIDFALPIGLVIGVLSGLTGVGGGIFLSPLLLFAGWADPRQTAAVSAAFIFVNSIAGLAGHLASVAALPAPIPLWAVAAAAGGWIGATRGSRHLAGVTIRRLLAVVLLIAGVKMMLVR